MICLDGALPTELRPVTQAEAFSMVAWLHRHLDPPEGWVCGVGLALVGGDLMGGGILCRPVAPKTAKDKGVAEISRVAVPEGFRNANSKLYASLRDAARALGYWKVQTFTLASESGASLRAVGFVLVRPAAEDKPRPAGAWGLSRPGRTASLFGEPEIQPEPKNRWECLLRKEPA